MGSGTTAIAAIQEGRNFIGIELLEEYVQLANQNIKKEIDRINMLKAQAVINF